MATTRKTPRLDLRLVSQDHLLGLARSMLERCSGQMARALLMTSRSNVTFDMLAKISNRCLSYSVTHSPTFTGLYLGPCLPVSRLWSIAPCLSLVLGELALHMTGVGCREGFNMHRKLAITSLGVTNTSCRADCTIDRGAVVVCLRPSALPSSMRSCESDCGVVSAAQSDLTSCLVRDTAETPLFCLLTAVRLRW